MLSKGADMLRAAVKRDTELLFQGQTTQLCSKLEAKPQSSICMSEGEWEQADQT